MKTVKAKIAAVLVGMCMPLLAQAGIAVIANPSVGITGLSLDEVVQLYMGRTSELPDGTTVVLFDLTAGASTRVEFAERVLLRNEQQLLNHWTRMIFTGKGQPPRALPSDADVLRMVASTPGAMGYIDSKLVTPRVKVLFRID